MPRRSNDEAMCGVGLALRWDFLDEAKQAADSVAFFEVSPENYMRRGGFFPRALAEIAECVPISTHSLMMSLGGGGPSDAYLAELRRFLGRFSARWHSDHLCFSDDDRGVFHDLLPLTFSTATACRVAENIQRVQDVLGVPMAIEHISYYTDAGGDPRAEPAFITEVLERADCGFLLDLNNLEVNAENFGFCPYAWLDKVPLERVFEVHVAGPERGAAGLWIDTHGAPVRPGTLDLLAHALPPS